MSKVKKYILQMVYGYEGDQSVLEKFQNFVFKPAVTKAKGANEHLYIAIIPYNPDTDEVFVLYDKDKKKWTVSEEHVDKNETPYETALGVYRETLGESVKKDNLMGPFYLSVEKVGKDFPDCKVHYIMWFNVETDGSDFAIDMDQYKETKWVSMRAIKRVIKDKKLLNAMLELRRQSKEKKKEEKESND